MSTKKKKNPAADDLIQSLMNDLNQSKSESSPQGEDVDSLFTVDSGDIPIEVLGSDQADRVESTNAAIANMWDSLEKNISDSADKEMESPLPVEPEGGEFFAEGFEIPSVGEDVYSGPSAEGGYQNAEDLFATPGVPSMSHPSGSSEEATKPVFSNEDKTVSIQNDGSPSSAYSQSDEATDKDKTLAVQGFANAKLGARRSQEPDAKVSIGQLRSGASSRPGSVFTSMDASLAQAENLKLAQQRILELEKEVEKFRAENEELASAGEIIRTRVDEYAIRITALEKEKKEIEESHQSEVLVLKGNLQYKETEVGKARLKIDELETRLKADFKKIRVKERELENRLELVRAEKAALVRSKDEYILDMKRKIDQLQSELDNYRGKVLELNKTLESNQDQFKRTVRALRLALSNLEVKEENLVPLKKAE